MLSKRAMTWGAAVLIGGLLTSTLEAQDKAKGKPPVKRNGAGVVPAAAEKVIDRPGTVREMEIYNGGRRTVRYFGENLSPSESTMLREMERLENEATYVRDLTTLKNQYVYSESLMEPFRRQIQKNLYGLNTSHTVSAGLGTYGGSGYGYGNAGAYPSYGYGGWGGYGNSVMGYLSDSGTVTQTLAYGIGDEGQLKAAFAPVIAAQATPEYASNINQAAERVFLRASATPRLQAAMRLPKAEEMLRERREIGLVEGEVTSGVTVTLKSGEKIQGKKMSEDKDWVYVDLAGGGRTKVRQSEVTRVDAANSGIAPAVYGK